MPVALTVGDFDDAVPFYRDIVGLEPSADRSRLCRLLQTSARTR